MKLPLFSFLLLLLAGRSISQSNIGHFDSHDLKTSTQIARNYINDSARVPLSGQKHMVSIGIIFPIDEFSRTHSMGFGINYSWSNGRFGQLNRLPKKALGFTVEAGIKYYLGKNSTVAGNDFRYGNYTYFHAFAGLIHNPFSKVNVRLMAGPALGLYMGNAEAGFGAQLEGNYFFNDRFSISPGLFVFKHNEANAHYSVFLKVSRCF